MSNLSIFNQLRIANGNSIVITNSDEYVRLTYDSLSPHAMSIWFYIPASELDLSRTLIKFFYTSGNDHRVIVNANRTITILLNPSRTTTATVKEGWNFLYFGSNKIYLNGVLETPSWSWFSGINYIEIGNGCKFYLDDFVIYTSEADYERIYNNNNFRELLKSTELSKAIMYIAFNDFIDGSEHLFKMGKMHNNSKAYYSKVGFSPEYLDNSQLYADGINDITTYDSITTSIKNGTIEFWARPETTGIMPGQTNSGTGMYISGNPIFFSGYTVDGINVTVVIMLTTQGIAFGVWKSSYFPAILSHAVTISNQVMTHFAFVIQNNVPSLYINGVFIKTGLAPTSGDIKLNYCLFNKINLSTHKYFKGSMKELRIWTTVRTEQEIQDNMDVQMDGTEVGLHRLYRGDRSPNELGTTLIERVANNNLTLQNYNLTDPPQAVLSPRRPIM